MTAHPVAREVTPWRFPLLGMDVSARRIGLATAEARGAAPQPLFTWHRTRPARDLAHCAEWIRKYDIGGVVIGLPVNMDGSEGPRAEEMRRFAEALQAQIVVPVWLQDERLSTVEAEEYARERGGTADVDAIAAALILQRFLHEE